MKPQQSRNAFSTPVDEETMVYDARRGSVHVLNRTAAFVWSLCDGQNSIKDIADRLAETFEVPEGIDLERDAAEILVQLEALHLLADDREAARSGGECAVAAPVESEAAGDPVIEGEGPGLEGEMDARPGREKSFARRALLDSGSG